MFAGGPKNYSYATGPTVSFSGQASLGRLGLSRFRFRLWPGFFRGRDVDGLLAGGHGGGHIGRVDFYLVHRQVSVHRHCSVDRTRKFLAHSTPLAHCHQNCPSSVGSGPPPISHSSLGPCESTSQRPSRLVQLF